MGVDGRDTSSCAVGPRRSRAALLGAVTLALGTAITGCTSSARPSVDLEQTVAGPSSTPTIRITEQVTSVVTTTATATTTITRTVPIKAPATPTATATVTPNATATATVTATVTPPPARFLLLSPHTPALPSIRATLERAAADAAAGAIIADVAAIDQLFSDTADVSARLDLLDRDLATLMSAGTPPGLDGPTYTARILGLRIFTAQAARDASKRRSAARSRWDVIRPEIASLLTQVNLGLGTAYSLPPPPATP